LPQLAVETFPSQIFWTLLGFFAVYLFISFVVTPKIEKTLENRVSHIDNLVQDAQKLESEATALEHDSFIALENAEMDSAAAEAKLMAAFREQSIEEKDVLYSKFSRKSKTESDALSKSVAASFLKVSEDLEVILDAAMKSISCSLPTKNIGDRS
jgi:F0F1-type ATP synthase membrane subunit b/b'